MRFATRYGKRIMRGPRTVKNFYYNKWSDYKIPKWSNLFSGQDVKSEYIFRENNNTDDMDLSDNDVKFHRHLRNRRFIIYFLLAISIDIYLFADNMSNIISYFHYKKNFLN